MWQLKIIVLVIWNGQTENKIKLKRPILKYGIKPDNNSNILGAGKPSTALWLPQEKGNWKCRLKMTSQRAGWLVTKCQMDTTNCLNDFSLICNWPQLWLSSLALPAVLRSAVGSRLGMHPAGSVQAPTSTTVPEVAVGFLVIPSSNKFCLICGVEHPCHHFILSFFFPPASHFHACSCK